MEYRIFGPAEYPVDVCAFMNGTFTYIFAFWLNLYIRKVSKDNNIFHPCPFSVSVKFPLLFCYYSEPAMI